jgi:hypothetical protein
MLCVSPHRCFLILFLQMMTSFHVLFESIMRIFVAPIASATSSGAVDQLCQTYPHVEELLLMFGTSVQSPVMIYVRNSPAA